MSSNSGQKGERERERNKKLAQVTYLSCVSDMHQQPCLDEEKINERFLEAEEVGGWGGDASMHMFGIMSVFSPRNFPQVLQQTVLAFLRERRCSGVLPGAQAAKGGGEGGRKVGEGGRCSLRARDSAKQSPK